MSPDDQYRLLVDALRLVAASSEEQLSRLPGFVCVTDEVVTLFADAYLLVPQLERVGKLSPEAARALRRLDDFFESMPEDESLADPASLSSHSFWSRARALASRALEQLGEEERSPDVSGTTWITGW